MEKIQLYLLRMVILLLVIQSQDKKMVLSSACIEKDLIKSCTVENCCHENVAFRNTLLMYCRSTCCNVACDSSSLLPSTQSIKLSKFKFILFEVTNDAAPLRVGNMLLCLWVNVRLSQAYDSNKRSSKKSYVLFRTHFEKFR